MSVCVTAGMLFDYLFLFLLLLLPPKHVRMSNGFNFSDSIFKKSFLSFQTALIKVKNQIHLFNFLRLLNILKIIIYLFCLLYRQLSLWRPSGHLQHQPVWKSELHVIFPSFSGGPV